MNCKLYTSSFSSYDKIPKDWLCIALFEYVPSQFKSQDIKNFLWVRSSIFSPAEEISNLNTSEKDIEETYLKGVFNNFQKWKKTYEGCFDIDVNTFSDWAQCFRKTLDLYDEEWKGVVFMTNEEQFENSFRKTFVKLMKYNKVEISELKDEDLATKHSAKYQQKIKELF